MNLREKKTEEIWNDRQTTSQANNKNNDDDDDTFNWKHQMRNARHKNKTKHFSKWNKNVALNLNGWN